MAEQAPREPGPVASDVAIALAVGMVRRAVATGGKVAGRLEPVVGPALRPEHWPRRMRGLAEKGFEYRRRATATVVRVYRTAAPAIVTDVLDQLDLAAIVRDVIDEMDLPEVIRVSTGSLAGETLRDARVQVMAADDTVSQWVGRVLHRRPGGTEPATRVGD